MGNQLKGSEFIEKDFYKDLIAQTNKAQRAVSKLVKSLVNGLGNDNKQIKLIHPKTLTELKKFNELVATSRKGITDLIALQKKQTQLELTATQIKKEALKVEQEEYRLTVLKKKEKERLAKIQAREIKLTQDSSNAYKILSAKVNKAQANFKRLAAQHGVNSRQAKRAAVAFDRVDKQLAAINARARDGRRDVGRYGLALGKLRGGLMSIGQAAGVSFGLFGAVRAIGSTVGVIKKYEDSMVTLVGVFRKSREELAPLEAKIREVGATTVRSASQTADLAEVLATLGESAENVEKLLLPATNLSIGLQTTAAEAGKFLVTTLNAFGAGRDEAEEYAETIGKIRTSTSLDFQRMRDSFQYLAPISKALGQDLAHTGALIGLLADNGIKAERAGRLMSTGQQKLAKNGMSLADALTIINKEASKGVSEIELLAIASELMGTQAAGLGIILASNTEKLEESTNAIRNSSGALQDLVDSQLTSLSSELALLNSAWEEYVISTDEATGANNKLKAVISFIRKNLSELIGVLGIAIGSWIAYKVAVKASIVATEIMAIRQRILATQILITRLNSIRAAQGLGAMTLQMRIFNTVSRANILGVMLTVVLLLVSAFGSFADGVGKASDNMSNLDKKAIKAKKSAEEFTVKVGKERTALSLLTKQLKATTYGTQERKTLLDKINSEYGVTIENLKDEAKFAEAVALAYIKIVDNIKKKIRAEIASNRLMTLLKEEIALEDALEEIKKSSAANEEIRRKNAMGKSESQLNAEVAQEKERNATMIRLNKERLAEIQKEKDKLEGKIVGTPTIVPTSPTDPTKPKGKTEAELQLEKDNEVLRKEKLLIEHKLSLAENGSEEEIELLIKLAEKKKEIALLNAKTDSDELQATVNFNNDMNRINAKILSNEETRLRKIEKTADDKAKADKKKADDALELAKENAKLINQIADSATKYLINRSNDRIQALDREMAAAQDRANTFRLIAAQGNLDAKESIAIEEKTQADATLKKEKELRKQKALELSLAMIKTYTAVLESGKDPAKALTSVLKTGTLLGTIVKSLPSFFSGTENTSRGNIDNKGGFLSVLHPNERVVPAKHNKYLSGVANSELPEMVSVYRQVMAMPELPSIVPKEDNSLAHKLDEVKDAINKIQVPHSTMEFNNIENTLTEIVKYKGRTERTERRGGIW